MHWGIPSAIDENRPNDGSHYGRRMYSPPPEGKGLGIKLFTEFINRDLKEDNGKQHE